MGDTLTVRLTEELAEALGREAHEAGVSKGEIVRQAIAARLKRASTGSVISKYIGVMRGPADLSTNKAYRRAWSRVRSRDRDGWTRLGTRNRGRGTRKR